MSTHLCQLTIPFSDLATICRVELHPFLPQHELVRFCQSKGILMQAYSPLGSSGGPVLQDPLVQSIAKAHNADPAQVVISWAAQRGVVVLPKSVTPSRIETNSKLITLSDEEMLQLNELHKQEGKAVRLVKPNVRCVSPRYDSLISLSMLTTLLLLPYSVLFSCSFATMQWGVDLKW